jgi:polyribonucleotide nucleotidyltransferase
MNLILGGKRDAINMIEVDAQQVSEEIVAEAVKTGHAAICQVCDLIDELVQRCGVAKEVELFELEQALIDEVQQACYEPLYKAYQIKVKAERNKAISDITEPLFDKYCVAAEGTAPRCTNVQLRRIPEIVQKKAVRRLLMEGRRPDGRGYDEIRPISCEVGGCPVRMGRPCLPAGKPRLSYPVHSVPGEMSS